MKLKSPIAVQLEVTNNCNNLCKHCYNYWRYDGKNRFEKEEDTLEARVRALADAEVFHIVFTGGEPLLKFKELLRGMEITASNNMTFNMNSNLTLMDRVKAKEIKNRGIRSVLTSFFSYDGQLMNEQMQNPNAFAHTLRGIEACLQEGLRVGTNMVVTRDNFNQVYDTGKFLFGFGVGGFNATRYVPPVSSEMMLERDQLLVMLEQLQALKDDGYNVGTLNPVPHCFAAGKYVELTQRRGCAAGILGAGIGVDGSMRACQHDKQVYGNILHEGVEEVWKRIPKWKDVYLPAACSGCGSSAECGGGCRHAGEIVSGSYTAVDPYFSGKVDRKDVEDHKVGNSDLLVFRKGVLVRSEEFGGVLYRSVRNFAVVDRSVYDIVPSLMRSQPFSVDMVAHVLGQEAEQVNEVFSFLHKREVIGGYKNGRDVGKHSSQSTAFEICH
ncbi:radical SAM protein [Candidatus Woesearchaeota archaeon]|nr:radical SAM protein [Candidatus Woesearchaeota archaeon]MBW3022233.1 radical SAM protein [Candidatus Woesearchaeota archaeon]